MKIQQVLSSSGLNNVGMYLQDGSFESEIGIFDFYPPKRTHWVAYINKYFFDSYGCAPPHKLS